VFSVARAREGAAHASPALALLAATVCRHCRLPHHPGVNARGGQRLSRCRGHERICGKGKRQQGRRACRVRHDLRTVCRRQLAPLDFPRQVHRRIHKNDRAGLRRRLREFRRQQRAGQRANPGQGQRRDRLRDLWPHAIIPAQRIAVADDEEFCWWFLPCWCHSVPVEYGRSSDHLQMRLQRRREDGKLTKSRMPKADETNFFPSSRLRCLTPGDHLGQPRAIWSSTVPSGPMSWTCSGICPTACVEQLRHGS